MLRQPPLSYHSRLSSASDSTPGPRAAGAYAPPPPPRRNCLGTSLARARAKGPRAAAARDRSWAACLASVGRKRTNRGGGGWSCVFWSSPRPLSNHRPQSSFHTLPRAVALYVTRPLARLVGGGRDRRARGFGRGHWNGEEEAGRRKCERQCHTAKRWRRYAGRVCGGGGARARISKERAEVDLRFSDQDSRHPIHADLCVFCSRVPHTHAPTMQALAPTRPHTIARTVSAAGKVRQNDAARQNGTHAHTTTHPTLYPLSRTHTAPRTAPSAPPAPPPCRGWQPAGRQPPFRR